MKERQKTVKEIKKNVFAYIVVIAAIWLSLCIFIKASVNSSFGADNQSIETKIGLEKYINFKLSDDDKGTLIQYDIKANMKYQSESENFVPIRQSQIKLELNQIDEKYPYDVKVITNSTDMTNGSKKVNDENYQYNSETGILLISASNENENENGELINSEKIGNQSTDEYIVIAYYDTYIEEVQERQLDVKVETVAILDEEDRIIRHEGELKLKVTEDIGEITNVIYNTEEIYNGYIKSNIINETNYQTEYNEKQRIVISKKGAQETVELLEDNTFIKIENDEENNLGNNGDLVYKSTKIRKKDIVNLLGEQGKLEILDKQSNILFTIDENTGYQEDGTVTINYENNLESIVLKTSSIQNIGILELQNTKVIKSSMTNATDAKIKTTAHIAGVKTEIVNGEEEKKSTYINKYENITSINDATTSVNLEISNRDWTNEEQNDVTFDVYINSNTTKDNMLKNPTVKIELPDEVEKVILQNSSAIYAQGLELQEPYLETNEEGKIVIAANLLGTQTQYDKNQLGLVTDLRISATIILKKDIENSEEKISFTYTNEYTLDESTEKINKDYDVEILSYNNQISMQQSQTRGISNEIQTTEVEGIELEVIPVKGDTTLKNGDVVYEGEFIKYNIKVTNTSDDQIENVRIVGTIPEGTVYGELEANYNDYMGKYEYNFYDSLSTKEIEIGTLKPNESYTEFYEVRVNDLGENETEKQIYTDIKIFVNDTQYNIYEIENVVNKADVKVFLGAFLDNGEDRWNYSLKVESNENKNVNVKIKFPEFYQLQLRVLAGGQDGTEIPVLLELNDSHTLIDTIETNKEYWYEGEIDSSAVRDNYQSQEIILTAVASAEVEEKEYVSNENRIKYEFRNISIIMTSENEGEEVNYEDEINYEIVVKNIGKTNYNSGETDSVAIDLQDYLPEEINPISMEYEYWEEVALEDQEGNEDEEEVETEWVKKVENKSINAKISDTDGNRLPNVDLTLNIPYGEQIIVKIKAKAGEVSEETRIENKAIVTMDEKLDIETSNLVQRTKTSNIVAHTILPYYEDISLPNSAEDDMDYIDDIEDPSEPTDPKDDNPTEKEDPNSKYSISGIAWVDENRDGKRQENEEKIKGINVILVNTQNSKITQKDIETDENGKYQISNVDEGKYIVLFKYDTQQYSLTEYQKEGVSSNTNSDAISKQITLNGEKTLFGVTDIIDLTASVKNIDIGLTKNGICDLKLDKYISKVSVNTSTGTKQYSYNDQKLAKVEIKAKEIEGATVVIEYKIVITNEGEIPTTVNQVIDYMPEGLMFSSELNNTWGMQKNNLLINNSLSNRIINAGESIEIPLILTKQMNQNSTGQYVNGAEIGNISNKLNVLDKDSIPGNESKKEDDYSEATLIISISTGGIIALGTIGCGILLLITLVVLNKKGILKLTKFSKAIKLSVFVLIFTSILLVNNNSFGKRTIVAKSPVWFNWISGSSIRNAYGSIYFYSNTLGGALCQNAGVAAASGNYYFSLATSLVNSGDTTTTNKDISLEKEDWENGVNVKQIDENGETYYIYGPLKSKCNIENVESKNVTYSVEVNRWNGFSADENGKKTVDNYLLDTDKYIICNKNGVEIKKLSGAGEKEIYVKIKKEDVGKGISEIKLKASTGEKSKKAGVKKGYCYYIYDAYHQVIKTINKCDAYKYDEDVEIVLEDDVSWKAFNINLNIKKVDESDNEKLLENVEFYLQGSSYPRFGERLNEDEFDKNKDLYDSETNPNGTVIIASNGKYYRRNSQYRYLKLIDESEEYKYGDDPKGYMVDDNGNYVEWVDSIEDATVFKTGEDEYNGPGECTIKGLRGNVLYYFVEKNNPNPGYEGNNGKRIHHIGEEGGPGVNYENPCGYIYELSMLNSKNGGNLFIEKKDANTEKALGGIEFNIKVTSNDYINNLGGEIEKTDINYNSYGGKYIKISSTAESEKPENANNEYIGAAYVQDMEFVDNKEQATKFITDSNGKIKIYGLAKGYYDVEENSVGDNWQYDIDNNYISWDFHTYCHSNYYTITEENRKIFEDFGFYGEEDNRGIHDNGNVAHIMVTRRSSKNIPTSGEAEDEKNGAKPYEELIFKNRKKYIQLSGYAFEDMIDGKNSTRNNLYDSDGEVASEELNDKDENVTVNKKDYLLENIPVRLYIDGNVITKTTDQNGRYIFGKDEKVEIEKLEDAYIEFEYNGMSYETTEIMKNDEGKILDNSGNVVENLSKTDMTRNSFNNNYAIIEENLAKNSDGEYTNSLRYSGPTEHVSKLIYGSSAVKYGYNGQLYPVSGVYKPYVMTANTFDADNNKILGQDLTINEIHKQDIETIENINLGLRQREQPDLAIAADISSVEVDVNGKEHVYEYSQRYKNQEEYDGTKLGIKFGNKYGTMSYKRPVYKADYVYDTNEIDDNRELKIYVNYVIRIKNTSTKLKAKVNSIVNYYDSDYKIKLVGTRQENGEISNYKEYNDPESSDSYKKITINLNDEIYGENIINPQSERELYIQYELNRQKVFDLMNDKINSRIKSLYTLTEINSYSIYDEFGNIYAGIDKDSKPGNAKIEDINTENKESFEDDTDTAPGFTLTHATYERSMRGKVFLDDTTGEMKIGEEREGNGKYDEGEKGIKDVQVTLKEISGTGKSYSSTTDDKGNFDISEFIPGNYILTYTWGDSIYSVKDYKGTVWKDDNIKEKYIDNNIDGIENKYWYKNLETRYSDARDDYDTRLTIDEIEDGKYVNNIEIMESTTNEMNIEIELENAKDIIPNGIGDIDNDGVIDDKDISAIQRYLNVGDNLTEEQIDKADIDRDGKITIYDISLIQKYIAGASNFKDNFEYKSNEDGTITVTSNLSVYLIKNIDFGIVERPRQSISLEKRVKRFKITLANGQTIADSEIIYENGQYKLSNEVKGVSYIPPSENLPRNGFVRVEIDNELIQGSTLEVTYEISARNDSEVDYASKDYYLYGKPSGEKVKLKANEIYDYLDKDFSFVADEDNNKWQLISQSDYKEEWNDENKTYIDEAYKEWNEAETDENGNKINQEGWKYYREEYKEVFEEWEKTNISEHKLNNKTILRLDINETDVDKELEPGDEQTYQELKVSKILSNTDEIDLSNESEITKITRTTATGRKIVPLYSKLYDESEEITITPPTGKADKTIEIIIISISLLIIIGTGIIFIKKKF